MLVFPYPKAQVNISIEKDDCYNWAAYMISCFDKKYVMSE